VHGERDGAVRTVGNVAAGAALDERRKPAPVEQQDGLLATGDGIAQRAVERLAEDAAEWIDRNGGVLDAHVDDLHPRQRATADPLRQGEESIRLAPGIGPAFE
jgi:hypothetical protein